MAAFSSPPEDAISTAISLNTALTGPSISPDYQSEKFDEYYEIDRTARVIREGGYKRVSEISFASCDAELDPGHTK
jgi:hypothetical protein